jgi:hypothetical protein
MEEERSAIVTIGGEEYELLLTTRATKLIGAKYGGLGSLGDKLLKAENFEMAIEEMVWLITLLANQPILIHNVKNKDNPKELLTEEEVEILTTPVELSAFKEAITTAMHKGTARFVQNEQESKNTPAG